MARQSIWTALLLSAGANLLVPSLLAAETCPVTPPAFGGSFDSGDSQVMGGPPARCTTGPNTQGYDVASIVVYVGATGSPGMMRCSLYESQASISEVSPGCRTCNGTGCGTPMMPQGWNTLPVVGPCHVDPSTPVLIECQPDNDQMQHGLIPGNNCDAPGSGYYLPGQSFASGFFPTSGTWNTTGPCAKAYYLTVAPVPEPAALEAFAVGLCTVSALRRRRVVARYPGCGGSHANPYIDGGLRPIESI
jgi:hypothetical protein